MKYQAKPLPPTDLPPLRTVGKPLRRVDALGKATGSTVYAGDFVMRNMLHAKVFRSAQPSALIRRLDISKAQALDGVVCVLTADDLPGGKLVTDMPGQTGQERRKRSDAPVLELKAGRKSTFRICAFVGFESGPRIPISTALRSTA